MLSSYESAGCRNIYRKIDLQISGAGYSRFYGDSGAWNKHSAVALVFDNSIFLSPLCPADVRRRA